MIKMQLKEKFLSKYRNKQPKWGFDGFGYIIYLRTYARKIVTHEGVERLERWDETVQRIIEGNFTIEARRLQELGKWNAEAEQALYAKMETGYYLTFNLIATPPGRGLWMSGTAYAERSGDAENNCWGTIAKPQAYVKGGYEFPSYAPVFMFDQAMKGGGVGVNIQRHYTEQMPVVANPTHIQFICSTDHADMLELFEQNKDIRFYDNSHLAVVQNEYFEAGYDFLEVADSREGWAGILGEVIDAHYLGGEKLVIDISAVRPKGSPIKGFGGIASGPKPLVKMLDVVNELLNQGQGRKLRPTEWGDIIQNIGTCVVAGNVRRTAIILIGDADDQEYIESKNYALEGNRVASQWRWASNNSVDIGVDTSRAELHNLAVNIFYNGEPGYVNLELSKNYGRIIDGFQLDVDGEVVVFNPCGEITLPPQSPCNLFEINLPRIHQLIELKLADESLYEIALQFATEYAYRVTFRHYEWESTRDVVYRHRRLGVAITGITDWVLLAHGSTAIIGYDAEGNAIYNPQVVAHLDRMYKEVKAVNAQHATYLEAPPSIKLTTVKPSGTMSLLMGVSPGQHFHWSAYMMRTVRVASNSFLLPILAECGYKIEDQISGYENDGTPLYDETTKVVYFPIKAPTAEHTAFQSAADVSLQDQAALQAMLATYWADNAVSATLSFHKPEPVNVVDENGTQILDAQGIPQTVVDTSGEEEVINEITDILHKYKGVIKSTSLLPHATGTYPQMPYTAITQDEYLEAVSTIVARPWEIINGDVLADAIEIEDDSTECVGGHCPVK